MKSNYAYIGLFTPVTTAKIKRLQHKLSERFGCSSFMGEWPPHVALSFGNLLSDLELEEVKSKCSDIASSFRIGVAHVSEISFSEVLEQGKKATLLRLKLGTTAQFNQISAAVSEVAEKYEMTTDFLTEGQFYIEIGTCEDPINMSTMVRLIEEENLLVVSIKEFAIYYSMMNNPKPPKALEIATFPFSS